MTTTDQGKVDARMMARCVELSRTARKHGEFPFASLIARGEEVIVETINAVARQRDITRHAELIAVSEAQRLLKTKHLSGLTLYSTVEPCPMCSFAIRETRISRIVYAIGSPMMGGSTKWNILGDDEMSRAMPEYFGRAAPQVVSGLLADEAAEVWRRAHPMAWAVIRRRGCFITQDKVSSATEAAEPTPGLFQRMREIFSL